MYCNNYSYLPTACKGGGDLHSGTLQKCKQQMYVAVYFTFSYVCVWYMCVLMSVYVYMWMCKCVFMCECRRLTPGVFLSHPLPYPLRQHLSLEPDFTYPANLASQVTWAPPPSRCWIISSLLFLPSIYMGAKNPKTGLQALLLYNKLFTTKTSPYSIHMYIPSLLATFPSFLFSFIFQIY